MIRDAIDNRSGLATCEDIHQPFSQYRAELEWLAYFITGDEAMAAACVADACALSVSHNHGFEEWLLTWARHATIRAALEMLRARTGQLSSTFDRQICTHDRHTPLTCSDVQLVVDETSLLVIRLDALSRCVLVTLGIEQYTASEAASFLGLSDTVTEAAYCHALDLLEVIRCERLRDADLYGAVCN
jgi:DNA-directed RNA polymerase specialized sigma24 family protein